MSENHCWICHKRITPILKRQHPLRDGYGNRFDRFNNHECELTNKIDFGGGMMNRYSFMDMKGGNRSILTRHEIGIEFNSADIIGADLRSRILLAYRHIRSEIHGVMAGRVGRPISQYVSVNFPPEKVLKTWALLYLIPDDNIPCKNIRPLDLIADKESLFSSCETTFKALGKEDAR